MLLKALKHIQKKHGYLPSEELKALSQRLQMPLYEVHGVATFYPHFRLRPPPENEIRVCCDLSCHLRGAASLKEILEKETQGSGLKDCPILPTSCLGRCDQAPAIAVNGKLLGDMKPSRASALVRAMARGRPRLNQRLPEYSRAGQISPYSGLPDYAVLRKVVLERQVGPVIAALKASGLRGLGGAGFPTGAKWDLVRQAPGRKKYVICNADESEPGTFKDRFLIQAHPGLVVEGMAIAACCVGATRGTIFVRHEYDREARLLAAEIRRARKMGALGNGLFGSDFRFHLDLFESPGGYICGEETALLEALEGKRAEPRNKPPFPGTRGLHGRPTLINNVETFAWVPAILHKGPEWFQGLGCNGAVGPKIMALSGDVNRPGVYEAPLGISARELIEKHGGGLSDRRQLKAFSPGGASSGFLPAAMADVPLDFKPLAAAGSMLGTAAVVVIGSGRCMLDLALNLGQFFSRESCGKCVPCRVGSAKIVEMLRQFQRGQGRPEDLDVLAEMSEAMVQSSICGLGQAAPNPITSVVRHFREELIEHIVSRRCPENVCGLAAAKIHS